MDTAERVQDYVPSVIHRHQSPDADGVLHSLIDFERTREAYLEGDYPFTPRIYGYERLDHTREARAWGDVETLLSNLTGALYPVAKIVFGYMGRRKTQNWMAHLFMRDLHCRDFAMRCSLFEPLRGPDWGLYDMEHLEGGAGRKSSLRVHIRYPHGALRAALLKFELDTYVCDARNEMVVYMAARRVFDERLGKALARMEDRDLYEDVRAFASHANSVNSMLKHRMAHRKLFDAWQFVFNVCEMPSVVAAEIYYALPVCAFRSHRPECESHRLRMLWNIKEMIVQPTPNYTRGLHAHWRSCTFDGHAFATAATVLQWNSRTFPEFPGHVFNAYTICEGRPCPEFGDHDMMHKWSRESRRYLDGMRFLPPTEPGTPETLGEDADLMDPFDGEDGVDGSDEDSVLAQSQTLDVVPPTPPRVDLTVEDSGDDTEEYDMWVRAEQARLLERMSSYA